MHMQSKSDNEFVALLKIVGSPLIPFHVPLEYCLSRPINVPSIVRLYHHAIYFVCFLGLVLRFDICFRFEFPPGLYYMV